MPLSNSILSYADCKDLCDRALASERGIKFRPATRRPRTALCSGSTSTVDSTGTTIGGFSPRTDPLYGRSAYDNLEFRARGAEVHIVKISSRANELAIEELTNEEVTGLL
jgi:hypothetical protein